MANGVYEINVNVTGADSGSGKLADKQGDVLQQQKSELQTPKAKSMQQSIKEKRLLTLDNIKAGAGTALAGGALGLEIYEQNAKFKGDSNSINTISSLKTGASKVLVAGGLFATGNPLAGVVFLGYTAWGMAKENRELINARANDSYQSTYYQRRLINDVSKRSR